MKLHLPKALMVAMLSIIGQSWADTVSFTPGTSDYFHQGTFTGGSWSNFCNGQAAYGSGHTLVLTGAGKTQKVDFNNFSFNSLVVEDDATGYIFSPSKGGSRNVIIGRGGENYASTINESITLESGSSSTFTIQGGQAWTIAKDATVTLKATNLNITGSYSLAGDGALDISNVTKINLGSTITNQNNTVKLGTTTVNINSTDILCGNIQRDVELANGGVDGNGYLQSVSNARLFSNASNVDASGTITYQIDGQSASCVEGEDYVVDCSGVSTDGIYLIAKDETYNTGVMGKATQLMVENGATITLNEALADTVKVVTGHGAIVHLGGEVVLNKSSLATTSSKGNLTGTGTYDLGSVDSADVYGPLTVGEFAGTVIATTGADSLNLTNFNGLSSNAKLQLSGFTGYLSDGTLSANLKLVNSDDNYALRLDNGSSGSDTTATFKGSIEGSGNIVYTWDVVGTGDSANAKTTHVFTGNTSQWKGQFVREIIGNGLGKFVEVKFTSGGNVFHKDGTGGVVDKATESRTDVIIDAGTTKTTFNGSIENAKAVTVNSDTDFMQAVGTQSLTLAAGKTMGIAADITTGSLTTMEDSYTLVFSGGTLKVSDSLTLNAASILLGEGMVFDSAEDYTLVSVTGEDSVLTMSGVEDWQGATYFINDMEYSSYLQQDGNNLVVSFKAIPEPTTVTLSLLALAGLAARRRRR